MPAAKQNSRGLDYLTGLLSGALAAIVALVSLVTLLASSEKLPPPPLANRLCVDEKLAFIRDHPPQQPNFLVVGSSVAWRNFDSSVIAETIPGARPINGAFCGTRLHHAAFAADWFLEQWPTIDNVLLVSGPQDYRDCSDDAAFFDPRDASDYVFGRSTRLRMHLQYIDPISMIRNVSRQRDVRSNPRIMTNEAGLTKYGDGPVENRREQGLRYGPLSDLDPSCFGSLRFLANSLSKGGKRLLVVTTPMHPEWKSRFDPDASTRTELRQGITKALQGTGARYWDADAAGVISDADDFADAVHIRWSAAGQFTRAIVKEFDKFAMRKPCHSALQR